MGRKLLTEGLQRILETFDNEDCPHEQYFRSILNEVIQEQDAGSHSELNGVLCRLPVEAIAVEDDWQLVQDHIEDKNWMEASFAIGMMEEEIFKLKEMLIAKISA